MKDNSYGLYTGVCGKIPHNTFDSPFHRAAHMAWENHNALAITFSKNARMFMDHARTAIAMKMLWKEIAGGGLEAHPSMLPIYNFHPIAYGRHWDMLDALLLNVTTFVNSSHHNLNLFDRELLIPAHQLMAKRTRPLRVLEIGVACGQNGNYLLERYPNLHYTGIDPTILPEVEERFKKFGSCDEKPASLHNTSTYNCINHARYNLYRELSEGVADQIPDKAFDLIFVDGPHTYKHVSRDIQNYSGKVKKGGLLVGHDFSCVHPPLLWGVTEQRLYGQTINYGMDGTWWWTVEE